MSLGTSNRDGGKTSESGHLRALAKIVTGDIITGLNAVQRAAGVNMSVDVQVGDAFVRRSDGTYAHPVFNDAVYNQVISAADGSNPRRDIVVIYVDYGQTPSTAVSNNTNGVVKIKVVNGTPAGSPVDPNGAAIQASVGAGNPYSILARVRVPAGQTSISNSLIDDLRTMITSNTNSVPTAAVQTNAITPIKMGFSLPVQTVVSRPTGITTGTTAIPLDDTIPQITEGTEYMSLAITPLFADSTLVIEVNAMLANTLAAKNMTGAIFKTGVSDALGVMTENNNAASGSQFLVVEASIVSGSTSAQTFTFRMGSNDTTTPGTTTLNGRSGARLFGATQKSYIKITEYKA